ncbi:MAG: phage major tail tube protein [Synergistaceae bacterium]|nr:phage major tail tube protein [Synergistaceae bacterium]
MIPTQNVNFSVYDRDSQDLLGIAEVTLPSFEAMTETISGSGLAGEIEMPVLGHFGGMTVELSWRTMTTDATKLAKQEGQYLDMRGSIEQYDERTGGIATIPIKIAVFALPKNLSMGNLNVGTGSDTSTELECTYIKVTLDGREVIEFDRFNYIYRVHGTDYLASVRRDLGKAG